MKKIIFTCLLLCMVTAAGTQLRNPFKQPTESSFVADSASLAVESTLIYALHDYRLAGVMLNDSQSYAVLELPNNQFQIMKIGDTITNLPITEIAVWGITIGEESNRIRLEIVN